MNPQLAVTDVGHVTCDICELWMTKDNDTKLLRAIAYKNKMIVRGEYGTVIMRKRDQKHPIRALCANACKSRLFNYFSPAESPTEIVWMASFRLFNHLISILRVISANSVVCLPHFYLFM